MATQETILDITKMLFRSPLANKPKPLPGETDADSIRNTARIYYLALQDLDNDLLMAATVQHLTNEKWFPAVADLRTAAVSLLNRADDTPDALTAWGTIRRAANTGSYRVVTYTDENGELAYRERGGVDIHPLAQKAINSLGGIKEFALSPLDDEPSWRARFIQAFETYQRRQAEDSMMIPQITGYIEKRRELGGQSVAGLISGVAKKLGSDTD
jgi:hypothetical protein